MILVSFESISNFVLFPSISPPLGACLDVWLSLQGARSSGLLCASVKGGPLPGGALSCGPQPCGDLPFLCLPHSWPHSTLFCPSGKVRQSCAACCGQRGASSPSQSARLPLLPCSHSRCSPSALPAALLCRSRASWHPAAGPWTRQAKRLLPSAAALGRPCPGLGVTEPCGLVARLPVRPRSCEPGDLPPAPSPFLLCASESGCCDSTWVESWFGFSHGGLSVPASHLSRKPWVPVWPCIVWSRCLASISWLDISLRGACPPVSPETQEGRKASFFSSTGFQRGVLTPR